MRYCAARRCIFIGKLFKKVLGLLKKIWDKLRKVLGPLLMILAVLAPVLAPWLATFSFPSWLSWLPTAYSALGKAGWGVSAAVGLGAGYLVDSESAGEIVDKIGTAVGDVGSAVGGAAGTTVSGFLKSTGGMLLLGFGAVLLLRKTS